MVIEQILIAFWKEIERYLNRYWSLSKEKLNRSLNENWIFVWTKIVRWPDLVMVKYWFLIPNMHETSEIHWIWFQVFTCTNRNITKHFITSRTSFLPKFEWKPPHRHNKHTYYNGRDMSLPLWWLSPIYQNAVHAF